MIEEYIYIFLKSEAHSYYSSEVVRSQKNFSWKRLSGPFSQMRS